MLEEKQPPKITKLPYRPVKPVEKVKLPERRVAQEERNIISEAFLGPNALPSGQERYLVNANFDQDNRLVLTFDTGERITTDPIQIMNVEQYVSIAAQAQAVDPLEGYRLADEDSDTAIKYYGYVKVNDPDYYILKIDHTATPITFRYANTSNNPAITDYQTEAWPSKALLTYDVIQDMSGF